MTGSPVTLVLIFAVVVCCDETNVVTQLGDDDFFSVMRSGNHLVEFTRTSSGDRRVHFTPAVVDDVAAKLRKEADINLSTVDCDAFPRVCSQFPFMESFPSIKLVRNRRVVEFRDYYGWLSDMGDDVPQPETLNDLILQFSLVSELFCVVLQSSPPAFALLSFPLMTLYLPRLCVHALRPRDPRDMPSQCQGGSERASLISRPLPEKRTILDDVLVQMMDNGPLNAKVWLADMAAMFTENKVLMGLLAMTGGVSGLVIGKSPKAQSLLAYVAACLVSSFIVGGYAFVVAQDVGRTWLHLRKWGCVACWASGAILGMLSFALGLCNSQPGQLEEMQNTAGPVKATVDGEGAPKDKVA